jgi:hypothetical protein
VVAEGGTGDQPPAPAGQQRGRIPPPPARFDAGRPGWETRQQPLVKRFLGTVVDASLRPQAFFTHLSREGVRGITWFAWVCILVGTVGQALWGLVMLPLVARLGEMATGGLSGADREAAAGTGDPVLKALVDAMNLTDETLARLGEAELQLWAALLLAPLTAFFTVHLLAGIIHFSLQPFRHPEQEAVPYETTYRFVVYAQAPLVFALIPTVGSLAGLYSLALLLIAMGKLHRVRALGLFGGVIAPALLLSFMWNQEVLPRIAGPLTQAVGMSSSSTEPDEGSATTTLASDDDDDDSDDDDDTSAADEYPPMPAADRDHSVETFVEGPWRFSERFYDSSRGRMRIRHRVATAEGDDGARALEVELKLLSETPIERVFVAVHAPDGAHFLPDSLVVPESALKHELDEERAYLLVGSLEAGAPVVLRARVKGLDDKRLLQRGPTVGREPAP